MLDLAPVIADVAARLGVTVPAATPAVNAAFAYVLDDTGADPDTLEQTDDLLVSFGLPLLAMRIFQAGPLPSQQISEFDPTFNGATLPRRLYDGLDQFWSHLRVNWGIA
jgi:hypothetical protein